jgi:hypothetical protein
MSRRSRYARAQHAVPRSPRVESSRSVPAPASAPVTDAVPANGHFADEPVMLPAAAEATAVLTPPPAEPTNGHAAVSLARPPSARAAASNGHPPAQEGPGCTAPQLRRFIKSRTYVPMHELRRRFGINGTEDDVTPLETDGRWIFVGLPPREGRLLGELVRGGDVGYELSLDPQTPVVVGVYPMRPVPRP